MVKSISRGTARTPNSQRAKESFSQKRNNQIAQDIVTPQANASFEDPSKLQQPVTPNISPQQAIQPNMTPVSPSASTQAFTGASGEQGLLTPLGQKAVDFTKSAAQGLARVSTPAVISRMALANQQNGGFSPEALGQGQSPLGDAFSITTPEQQQQTQDALKALGAISTAASLGSSASAIASGIGKKSIQEIVETTAANSFKDGNFMYQTDKAGRIIGRIATNPKVVAQTASIISKETAKKWAARGLAITASSLIGLGYGVNGYGEWGNLDNAKTAVNVINDKVLRTNDPQLISEYNALQNEVFSEDLPAIGRLLIPYYGLKSVEKATKVQLFTKKVNDRLNQEYSNALNSSQMNAPSSGGFNTAAVIKMTQDQETIKTDEAKQRTDYYNQQRKLYDELARKAEVQARNEDAAFWRKEKEHTYAREREEQQRTAEFWTEYRKRLKDMSEDSAPTALSFGLLR